MKRCTRCGEVKEESNFYKKGSSKSPHCKICDRVLRKETQKRWTAENEKLIQARKDKGCYNCGEKHPLVLQFHHYIPIGQGGNQQGKKGRYKYARITDVKLNNSPRILAEHLKGCYVLCANCHLLVHGGEITLPPPAKDIPKNSGEPV